MSITSNDFFLQVKALFAEEEDLLLFSIFLIKGEFVHPEHIRTGELMVYTETKQKITNPILFDMGYGTSDGSVRIYLIHPIQAVEYSYTVSVVTDTEVSLRETGIVTPAPRLTGADRDFVQESELLFPQPDPRYPHLQHPIG